MIRATQFRVDPVPVDSKPRVPGGRKRFVPKETRMRLYALMKGQRDIEKEINAIMDSLSDGTAWGQGRGRTSILRRIYLERGR